MSMKIKATHIEYSKQHGCYVKVHECVDGDSIRWFVETNSGELNPISNDAYIWNEY